MVTFETEKLIGKRRDSKGAHRLYVEGSCLSTDEKPLNVDNGSKLLEIDTSTLYVFDLDANTWRAWTCWT